MGTQGTDYTPQQLPNLRQLMKLPPAPPAARVQERGLGRLVCAPAETAGSRQGSMSSQHASPVKKSLETNRTITLLAGLVLSSVIHTVSANGDHPRKHQASAGLASGAVQCGRELLCATQRQQPALSRYLAAHMPTGSAQAPGSAPALSTQVLPPTPSGEQD